jgi:hypothetical protein
MKYEVRCECGVPHSVTGADAGASLRCDCGRTVDVPPLHQLRVAAGQFSASPELILESLLKNKELPDTNECAFCSCSTDGVVWAELVYAQPESKHDAEELGGWLVGGCLVAVLFGVAKFFSRPEPQRDQRYVGYQVKYRIPVRCCEACALTLTEKKLHDAVWRQRVYVQVLVKYPQLLVWRAK